MQLNFTKVLLLSFSRKATMGTAKFSAALSAPVKNALGWGEVPDWQKSSNPVGKLAASQIALDPRDPTLQKHSVILDGVTSVDGFEIIRTEATGKTAKKTKSFKTELLFAVHFTDPAGAKKLEQYMQTANAGDSSMVVTYEKEPEQGELPGTEESGEFEGMVEEIKKKRKKEE